MSYHRAFIDPVKAGYLVTFLVSDDVTLVILIHLYSREMKPVEQLLSIQHEYTGGIKVEIFL